MLNAAIATAVIGTLCLSGSATATYFSECQHHVERPAWGADGRPYGFENGRSCIARTWGQQQQYSGYQQKPTYQQPSYGQQPTYQQPTYQPNYRQYFGAAPARYNYNNAPTYEQPAPPQYQQPAPPQYQQPPPPTQYQQPPPPTGYQQPPQQNPMKAIAVVLPDKASDKGVKGTVTMTQESEEKQTTIEIYLENVPKGKHGIHFHEFGLSQPWNCTTAGLHYNPFGKNHGAPDAQERHVGDLGNIEAGDDGIVKVTLQDSYVKLFGDNQVLGRTFVVHANVDDFGLTTAEQSKITGNAGGRLACGIVGIVKA
ncbi:Superoxide dismutase [Cu-Zn] [Borealophlyctis nickersoniae]|nr:Superoxide dismutase [Cu-Zn] [Borealophlyctis nickersoniae]